jgi:hypothetical protein
MQNIKYKLVCIGTGMCLLNYVKGFLYGLEIIPVTHMEVNNLAMNTHKNCTSQLKMNTNC